MDRKETQNITSCIVLTNRRQEKNGGTRDSLFCNKGNKTTFFHNYRTRNHVIDKETQRKQTLPYYSPSISNLKPTP